MGRSQTKYLFRTAIFCLFAAPLVGAAQNRYPSNYTGTRFPYDNSATSAYGQLPGEPERDTVVKEKRPKKPLESFYFDDSTRARRIFAWTVSLRNNDIRLTPVDTLLAGFQTDYVFDRNDVGSASLGNLGGSAIPYHYFLRPEARDFSFVQSWRPYQMTPEQVLFYNARTPYTNITYQLFGGQKSKEESQFHGLISQNISPSTSFNLDYRADGTKGMYLHQRALSRYFSANFVHTGKRYAVHAGYIYNVGDIDENGGVQDPADVTDTLVDLPDNIPVNLTNAHNLYKGNTYYLTQSYAFPLRRTRADELTIERIPTIFFGNSFEYTSYKRTYTDQGEDFDYYENAYIDPLNTHDSIHESRMDVRLFAQLQPYNRNGVLGLLTGGFGYARHNYYHFVPQNYQNEYYGQGGSEGLSSVYLYGMASGAVSKYARWEADGQLGMSGYRAGDFDVGGKLSLSAFVGRKLENGERKHPLTLEGTVRIVSREADYWQQTYFSNHYAWINQFDKENFTQFGVRFYAPSIGFEIGGNYQVANNKIYYGPWVEPQQYAGTLSVASGYLRKDFTLGGFHLNHRILLQWSSNNDVAPVPMGSAFLSYYFQVEAVPEVLSIQIGVDGRYQTRYYAFGYDPAVGQFYNQTSVQLGEYPYIDPFVSAKWKRLRMLVKGQNIGPALFGPGNYFTVVDYPQNRTMLKASISWAFYD